MNAVILALALSGISQTPPETKTLYQPETKISFTTQHIKGQVTRPGNDYVLVRRGARFKSLVTTRASFVSELLKSVDNL